MPVSPTVRRRRLAAELSRLREVSGRTIDDVAQAVGVSKSSLSRIENGLVVPRIPVLRALLQAYVVEPERAAWLEQLCRDAAKKGWWELGGTGVMWDATRTLIGLEAEAVRINHFSTGLVAGLLQTPEYARAVVRVCLPDLSDDDVDALVETRIRRQARLGEFRLWVILAEETLLRPVGGPSVMCAQLGRLVEIASDVPKVTVQVLGLEAGEHPGISGSFKVLGFEQPSDPEVVYVEGSLWDACIEETDVVSAYKSFFEVLQATALSPIESKGRLLKHMEGFGA